MKPTKAQIVFDALQAGPMTLQELVDKTGLRCGQVREALVVLGRKHLYDCRSLAFLYTLHDDAVRPKDERGRPRVRAVE